MAKSSEVLGHDESEGRPSVDSVSDELRSQVAAGQCVAIRGKQGLLHRIIASAYSCLCSSFLGLVPAELDVDTVAIQPPNYRKSLAVFVRICTADCRFVLYLNQVCSVLFLVHYCYRRMDRRASCGTVGADFGRYPPTASFSSSFSSSSLPEVTVVRVGVTA